MFINMKITHSLLGIFLSLAYVPYSLAAPVTLRLAYSDIESYPFQLGNGHKVFDPPGLAIDVINQAVNDLGIEVEFVRLPGKRVLEYIKEGKVDGGFIFSYNSERALYARYPMVGDKSDSSKRIATLEYYFYKLEDQPFDWDGTSLIDSSNKVVGAHLGFSVVKELKNKNIKVDEVRTTRQLLEMLSNKRISAIAIQDNMVKAFLKNKRWSNVEKVMPAIIKKDYYLVLSSQFVQLKPDLANLIWNSIGDVRDEVMTQSMSKYLNQ